jgi:hypothetical protein
VPEPRLTALGQFHRRADAVLTEARSPSVSECRRLDSPPTEPLLAIWALVTKRDLE